MKTYLVALCFLLLVVVTECSKILIIVGHSARSHYNIFVPLIEELASRKHDITVQGYFTIGKSLPNVKEMVILKGAIGNTAAVKDYFTNALKYGPISEIKTFGQSRAENCAEYLNDDTSKALLDAGMKYDLVIVDMFFADCPTAVASLAGKHIVNLCSNGFYAWQATSAPLPLSYIPHPSLLIPSNMNFFQRLGNVISVIGSRYFYKYLVQANNQKVISAILPQAGTIEEIEQKVALTLTNGDPVVDPPRPSMPNIVPVGGMQCRKANPLPKDLNNFVESSGDYGFIIFGFGSNMKAEFLSDEIVQNVIKAFSRLKQKVVWKFEKNLENLPKNVKVVKWMPQQDLLGHPKARLFVTHSGLLSLQEAIYHGVPVIGVPFFFDQRGNSIRIQELGIGERFDFLNITADGFYEVISKVLSDKRYVENMKKYSAIFKDQSEKPIERAIYWIEYVIRHNGARHFRSAGEDLNFFQYFLIDVIGLLLLAAVIIIGLLFYLVKIGLRMLYRRTKSKCDAKKKRE